MTEAQAASALDHPNICTIHEIDQTADGQLFVAMAYYDGETLRDRIARGALGVDEALGVVFYEMLTQSQPWPNTRLPS